MVAARAYVVDIAAAAVVAVVVQARVLVPVAGWTATSPLKPQELVEAAVVAAA